MIVSWLLAARPKTLVASVIPVSLGVSLAFNQHRELSFCLIGMCLTFAVLVQIATNFANDYFDFVRGADEHRTLGPQRFSSKGLIQGVHLRNISFLLLILAFALGVFIMETSGSSRFLLLVGISSVICAIAYTGGPFPLAYNGLGDVFVILFFGFIAVGVTHYVLLTDAGEMWIPNWLIPMGTGFMINNLLVVNNYRDRKTDQKVNKNTSVVLLGKNFGLALYFCGYLIPCVLCPLIENRIRLVTVLFPFGLYLVFRLSRAKEKSDYSFLLSSSAISVLFFGILTSWSLVS
jgi:1,4-dihydroxy-2-naphthoate octaprenyltransferase